MRPHSAGDCKRESSPQAAPQLAKMPSQEGRWRQSRLRPGQVASGMRVRAGVAPRVASGDRAASKGKPAGGCSSFKRRVEQEHRCAAPHARASHFWLLHALVPSLVFRDPCGDDSSLPPRSHACFRTALARNSDRPWCVCACAQALEPLTMGAPRAR